MKKSSYIGLAVLIIVAAVLLVINKPRMEDGRMEKSGDSMMMEDDGHMMDDGSMMNDEAMETSTPTSQPIVWQNTALLTDVTDSATLIGEVNTGGNASGVAYNRYEDESGYTMLAEFAGLPTPTDDSFYEGWIVRTGADMSVISTGPLEQEAPGQYTNVYRSNENMTDHTLYVLTIEPNDGDPAPAEHVVEGRFVAN